MFLYVLRCFIMCACRFWLCVALFITCIRNPFCTDIHLPCLWLRGILPADLCLDHPIPPPPLVDDIVVFDPFSVVLLGSDWPPGLYGTDGTGGKCWVSGEVTLPSGVVGVGCRDRLEWTLISCSWRSADCPQGGIVCYVCCCEEGALWHYHDSFRFENQCRHVLQVSYGRPGVRLRVGSGLATCARATACWETNNPKDAGKQWHSSRIRLAKQNNPLIRSGL